MAETLGFDPAQISTIIFDHGNTLVEFGKHQILYQNNELYKGLISRYGECDPADIKAVRDRQIVRPFQNGFQENNLYEICAELVREVYKVEPEKEDVQQLVQIRCKSYLYGMEPDQDLIRVLAGLQARYQLGLLSNYPISPPVHEGLRIVEIDSFFQAVVVSADIGYVKPHPLPFKAVLEKMNVRAANAVYVGDNWLADIQGAKRIGMKAIYTTQYVPYEKFDPEQGDFEPDARITHINQLPALFGLNDM